MKRIRILPEILSNKIAAGEVVERPASVVKELVENAIDADSTRIIVEIEQGGRKLIRVSDNGTGMGKDDAILSLERYATSKIERDPDLFAIRTLGFRGEALPSIASVSRFTLVTRMAQEDTGTQIEVKGGQIKKVFDVGAPAGTMITVSGLFFNTPARRKFLKSVITEMGHIADTIASMALCRPHVQFRLLHNDRIVKDWPTAINPMDRVVDVLGSAIRNSFFPVERKTETVTVTGWVASGNHNRATASGIYLFVNGRWVKDRVIQHALFAGYRGRLMKGRYPVAVLFVQVPFDQVDVNVHPTKHEIRFAHQKEVHDTMEAAVADALRLSDPTRWNITEPETIRDAMDPPSVSEPAAGFRSPSTGESIAVAEKSAGIESERKQPTDRIDPFVPAAFRPVSQAASSGWSNEMQTPSSPKPAEAPFTRQAPLWKPRFFADLTVIGQYRGTYILCESSNGLILIDQHAAHERIVFEQLKNQSEGKRPASQRLLLPETIDLGFREAQILERLCPELDRHGLEIEPFGGNTFVVKALPTLLDSGNVPNLVSRIVEKTAEIGVNEKIDTILDGCLMVMACHNAIRAHQRLTDTQITAMLKQLDDCNNPSHCPHGRPIWIQWTTRELEKQFQRIV